MSPKKDPKQQNDRTVNPEGSNGLPSRCKICHSILYQFRDCLHRYENPEQAEVFQSENTDDVVLFICSNSDVMCLLTSEAINSVVFYSGCISTVAGTNCIYCFLDGLSPDELAAVRRELLIMDITCHGLYVTMDLHDVLLRMRESRPAPPSIDIMFYTVFCFLDMIQFLS